MHSPLVGMPHKHGLGEQLVLADIEELGGREVPQDLVPEQLHEDVEVGVALEHLGLVLGGHLGEVGEEAAEEAGADLKN